jgi:uncharacterized protein
VTANSAVRALALALALCGPLVAGAQVAIPPPGARVTDQTATLTRDQQAALEKTLQAFEASKGSQIAVLIVPTTAPEPIEQYALRVAEQWKLGRKGVDDGALLVVAKNDRTLRIEVGYGLEGALNDATSKRIVSDTIVPRFKQGDFYGGISAGVDRMIRVIEGEPLPQPATTSSGRDQDIRQLAPVLLLLALVVGMGLRSMLGRVPGAITTGAVVAALAWVLAGAIAVALMAGAIAFLFTLFGVGAGGHGGSHGGGRRHGGFGRGGLGGGFGGGGGGFGGGGASGRW